MYFFLRNEQISFANIFTQLNTEIRVPNELILEILILQNYIGVCIQLSYMQLFLRA